MSALFGYVTVERRMRQDCQGGGGSVSLNLREASRAEDTVWGSSIGRCYLTEIPTHAWIAQVTVSTPECVFFYFFHLFLLVGG